MNQTIRGHGASSAEIMLIADCATPEDIASGEALSGSQEGMLRSLLNERGLNINETWRTCLFKDKTAKEKLNQKNKRDKDKGYEELKLEFPGFSQQIQSEIEGIQPNIIVPLGEYSFQHLSGLKSIYKYRGSILSLREDYRQLYKDSKIPKVIPTFGPGIINENWTSKAYVSIDYSKIAKYKNFYREVKPDGILWIAKSSDEFSTYLKRVNWKDNFLVFDIETVFGIPVCISFCFDENEAVCVPLEDYEAIDTANRILLWQQVAKVLEASIEKVNQNIKYDQTIMERFHFRVNCVSGNDTVLRAGLLYPELPKNLGFLTSIYTEMPYHKDEGKNEKDKSKLYLYCAKDALATRRIFVQQTEELKELELEELHEKTKKLFHIYKKIDGKGIRVDELARSYLVAKYSTMLDVHKSVLCHLANREINVRSYPQIDLLMKDLKYPKRASYDEDTIEELVGWPLADPLGPVILKEIIYIRKIFKILEYLNTVRHPDGRWRANYNLSGTETGRTSCNSSIDQMFELVAGVVTFNDSTRAGRSLQTISKHGFLIGNEVIGKDIRKIFVASPGKILVEVDLSGAEARVDCVLSMSFDLLDRFENPGIHKYTGSILYDKPAEEIKKNTLEYHLSKIFRHATERRIGPKRLAQITHKSIAECETKLAKLHDAEPNIKAVFHKDIEDYVTKYRNLTTPHGRRRDFFARADHSMFNEAISFYPQAIVSDQNKFSFIDLTEEWSSIGKDTDIYLNEAHDSSLVEIDPGDLEFYAKTAKKYLERPIDFRKGSIKRDFELVIPCEVEYGECWYGMEEFKI